MIAHSMMPYYIPQKKQSPQFLLLPDIFIGSPQETQVESITPGTAYSFPSIVCKESQDLLLPINMPLRQTRTEEELWKRVKEYEHDHKIVSILTNYIHKKENPKEVLISFFSDTLNITILSHINETKPSINELISEVQDYWKVIECLVEAHKLNLIDIDGSRLVLKEGTRGLLKEILYDD